MVIIPYGVGTLFVFEKWKKLKEGPREIRGQRYPCAALLYAFSDQGSGPDSGPEGQCLLYNEEGYFPQLPSTPTLLSPTLVSRVLPQSYDTWTEGFM